MEDLLIDIMLTPRKEILARCGKCNAVVRRVDYKGYGDCARKKKEAMNIAECPYCKSVFREEYSAVIPWEKTENGDWLAKAKNGDFRVWKDGHVYKWRYRKYGEKYPEEIHVAREKAVAQKECTRHKEWKL